VVRVIERFLLEKIKDTYGKPVASGMYLYQLKMANFVKTKKLVLLK